MRASVSTAVDLDTLRVSVSAPRHPLTIAFTALWFSGWLLTILVAGLALVRNPVADVGSTAVWLAIWVAAGVPVAIALLWTAGGKRDTIVITGPSLVLERESPWFTRSHRLDAFSASHLHVAPPTGQFEDITAVQQFWTGGAGRIQFDSGRRTFRFGVGLDDADAAGIVATIASRLPHLVAVRPEGLAHSAAIREACCTPTSVGRRSSMR